MKQFAEAGVKFTGDYEVAEPRFACNVVIQDKQEAVQVLNELASVFRACFIMQTE